MVSTWYTGNIAGRCIACGGTYPGNQLLSSANDGSGEHVCQWCTSEHIATFLEWLSRLCPFCTLLVEPEHYNFIGQEFFGEPALIGGIRSCGDCYEVASSTESGEALVKELHAR